MSLLKRGNRYWTDFTVDGLRYRKPLRTTDLNLAKQRERALIQKASRGALGAREQPARGGG